eukprot:8336838-Pyramimonas_sp.AAC.1
MGHPMQSAAMPPPLRPAPMRVYESLVVIDEHGRCLPLHMGDPSRLEAVSIAANFPRLKDNMKKEKVLPILVEANEDVSKSLQRAEDIAKLAPMSAADDKWGECLICARA